MQKIEKIGVDFSWGMWYNNAARQARGRAGKRKGLCSEVKHSPNFGGGTLDNSKERACFYFGGGIGKRVSARPLFSTV